MTSSGTTFAWAEATGGALTPAERRAALAAIARTYAEFLVLSPLRLRPRRQGVAPPAVPDSRLARAAEEAAAAQPPAVLHHARRTWVFGAALAARDGAAPDPELLYVASLLHDAGLVAAVAGEDFTIRSAQVIRALDDQARDDDPRLARAADAAVAHATPGLTREDQLEGYYVQAGAMADLVGLRAWDLPRGCWRGAHAADPASGVRREVQRLVREEARAVPEGRFALLHRTGFGLTARFAPVVHR